VFEPIETDESGVVEGFGIIVLLLLQSVVVLEGMKRERERVAHGMML